MISWSKAVQTPFYVNCKPSSMIPKGKYSVFNISKTQDRERQVDCIISSEKFVIEHK